MKKSDNEKSLRERLIDWVAGGGTIISFHRQNAERSERTYRRWASEPEFEAEVRKRSSEMTATLVRRLRAIALGSTDELLKLRSDPDPRIRMAAVRTAISALPIMATHADLEARLTDLEEIARRETR